MLDNSENLHISIATVCRHAFRSTVCPFLQLFIRCDDRPSTSVIYDAQQRRHRLACPFLAAIIA